MTNDQAPMINEASQSNRELVIGAWSFGSAVAGDGSPKYHIRQVGPALGHQAGTAASYRTLLARLLGGRLVPRATQHKPVPPAAESWVARSFLGAAAA